MTVLKITIEPGEDVELVKKLLSKFSSVKDINEEVISGPDVGNADELGSAYQKIKKVQGEIGDKKLFEDIKDPLEWQREIRKEWDRDF